MLLLTCRHLVVDYQGRGEPVHAVRDLTLTCRGGEFVSIIGPSGCGKSTLLRAVARLIQPTRGTISHGGPASISMVFQESALFPWLTVLKNAAFALEAAGVARGEREDRARAMLGRFGLSGRENAYPHQLSAGMRQRVALVRAFLTTPDFLLLDEPFAALDAQTRMMLQQELLELWNLNRPGVLFVTHDIDEAITLSDRVLVLSRQPGTVVAEYSVPLPRPRTPAVCVDPAFAQLKATLLAQLGLAHPTAALYTTVTSGSYA